MLMHPVLERGKGFRENENFTGKARQKKGDVRLEALFKYVSAIVLHTKSVSVLASRTSLVESKKRLVDANETAIYASGDHRACRELYPEDYTRIVSPFISL